MCDHIALIHKSNKLIEGRLDEVKKQYRTNTFEVGILGSNNHQISGELGQKYQVSSANFKTLDDELKMEITLPEGTSSRQLLNDLIQKGDVTYFVEKIPSVNDIFIQTVSKK
jgi:ABC-2 type transport system ATP-binding protein